MESKAIHFRPHGQCREQLAELMKWSNGDRTTVINRAVAELWQREVSKRPDPNTEQKSP